jgi:hypothetical protein
MKPITGGGLQQCQKSLFIHKWKNNMLNKYSRIARIYPAVLCSLPIFLLNYFFLKFYTADFLSSLNGVKWTGGITLSLVLTFLLAQTARFIGKELFEKTHFKDELSMPTTEMLLHLDENYSSDHKKRLHAKIFSDFGIQVCTAQEEISENERARKIIVECVSMIRGKVKDGRLLLQHNIEYGFIRNLVGGSVISVFLSIINLFIFGYFFYNQLAFSLSLFMAIFYLAMVMMGRFLLGRYGIRYAKVLIQEYLLT